MLAVPLEAFPLLAPMVSRACVESGEWAVPAAAPAIGGPLVVFTSAQAVRARPAPRASVRVWIRIRCHPPKGSAATLAALSVQCRSQHLAARAMPPLSASRY